MPEASLVHALKEFVNSHGLVRPAQSVVLAVSGGIDSVVLLDLMATLRKEWGLQLVIGHFNHQLRGTESDEDEKFVRSLGEQYGIDCYIERADTGSAAAYEHRSLQETARNLRYKFLTGLRSSLEFHAIATAHQADDNLETILFNLFRGSGVSGMTGIPAYREDRKVIRPLLFARRDQIALYAAERGLGFREDSSNEKTDYSRNFLRHVIIPQIREKINPNVTATVGRTAELFTGIEAYLRSQLDSLLPQIILGQNGGMVVLDRDRVLELPLFLQESLLRDLARDVAESEADFATVKALLNVSKGESGSAYPFPGDTVFYRDRDRLIFRRTSGQGEFEYRIEPGQCYHFGNFSFASQTVSKAEFTADPFIECIDADRIRAPLTLRTWHYGDRFMPLGMAAEKKLSDFFIDEKVPIYEKPAIPILVSGGEIVWVCGKRLDDRFKVTNETKHILKLEYKPKP